MKVFAMLSGGVDSSVAAARLVDSGFDVTGIYLRNWSPDNITSPKVREMLKSCNSDEDEVYAKATADHIDIPFRVINFEQQYWDKVIEPFFAGIKNGDMPNPDIWCNQFIKYGVFLDWALANGADLVASGHYAQIKSKIKNQKSKTPIKNKKVIQEKYFLLRGVDPAKDQSYFLSHVPKEKLKFALFPIGHMFKAQVREEALMRGLPTATKPDSQGICFVGKIPIKEFLKERFKENKGDVVLADGSVVGRHDGVWFYTIGQRTGWKPTRINNSKLIINNFGNDIPALYIVEKDLKENILVVGEDDGSEPLYRKEFSADNWNFFELPKQNVLYDIEIRYHQQPKSRGRITKIQDTITKSPPKAGSRNQEILNKVAGQISNNKNQIQKIMKIENCLSAKASLALWAGVLKIRLEKPVRAVTPGQTVVLSKGDRIIGSGIIQLNE